MNVLSYRFLILVTFQIIFGYKHLTECLTNTQQPLEFPTVKSVTQSGMGFTRCIKKDCNRLVNRRSDTIKKRQNTNPTEASANVKDESKKDQKRWLDSHNKYRATYNAKALVWNDSVTPAAKSEVSTCVWEHSRGPFGENIAAGQPDLEGVVSDWVNGPGEKSDYNPSNPKFSHFTQVVWASTESISCARNSCKSMKGINLPQSPILFWACEYFPPGNVIGQFSQNVKSGPGGVPLK
ncbi:uncharacterized protein MELLADRAFT_107118 [Melampsora larici-populina 98AG31]|uniref:Secreted protein n=1 Tax=Melampsora larici-populina (strain 98AG31 / pathotype 3-4-7) TaxID=747676 RepID=F4RNR0_MELLP|nr:uncharacterized protein MELLADRAFT_107118 [Melampsora larici-populina 98AG31]EGG06052.1 secreted protein [Melampsora larici-populina 98AG31]